MDFADNRIGIVHNCGGEVEQTMKYHSSLRPMPVVLCHGCGQQWRRDVLVSMRPEEVAERFHLVGPKVEVMYRVVEVEVEGRRFHKTVLA
jgi:predicted esterase